ncbi:low affinity copper transporter [Phlyctema vagabunda]|uniref:Copper transport protein n=1 Tax=Phlyctema vagabunda TaxID=108571 RepID=A0ABR4P5A5_9HELO
MDMSMTSSTGSMSMSISPISTISGMSMASSTSPSMSTSSDTMMGMDSMAMTFFTSSTTPLYSMAWTPSTDGQYAGTCIFLIAFAAVFRALLAVRVHFYRLLAAADAHRNGGKAYEPYREETSTQPQWRAKEAIMLGSIDVVLAGVGYLLMIAVMTMNVGYFLSVLAGIFVGSVVFSRFIASSPAC